MGGGNGDGHREGMAYSGTVGKQGDMQSLRRGQAGSPGAQGHFRAGLVC